jgi:hypothetical protein
MASIYNKSQNDIVYERFMITSYALIPKPGDEPSTEFSNHNQTDPKNDPFKPENVPIYR